MEALQAVDDRANRPISLDPPPVREPGRHYSRDPTSGSDTALLSLFSRSRSDLDTDVENWLSETGIVEMDTSSSRTSDYGRRNMSPDLYSEEGASSVYPIPLQDQNSPRNRRRRSRNKYSHLLSNAHESARRRSSTVSDQGKYSRLLRPTSDVSRSTRPISDNDGDSNESESPKTLPVRTDSVSSSTGVSRSPSNAHRDHGDEIKGILQSRKIQKTTEALSARTVRLGDTLDTAALDLFDGWDLDDDAIYTLVMKSQSDLRTLSASQSRIGSSVKDTAMRDVRREPHETLVCRSFDDDGKERALTRPKGHELQLARVLSDNRVLEPALGTCITLSRHSTEETRNMPSSLSWLSGIKSLLCHRPMPGMSIEEENQLRRNAEFIGPVGLPGGTGERPRNKSEQIEIIDVQENFSNDVFEFGDSGGIVFAARSGKRDKRRMPWWKREQWERLSSPETIDASKPVGSFSRPSSQAIKRVENRESTGPVSPRRGSEMRPEDQTIGTIGEVFKTVADEWESKLRVHNEGLNTISSERRKPPVESRRVRLSRNGYVDPLESGTTTTGNSVPTTETGSTHVPSPKTTNSPTWRYSREVTPLEQLERSTYPVVESASSDQSATEFSPSALPLRLDNAESCAESGTIHGHNIESRRSTLERDSATGPLSFGSPFSKGVQYRGDQPARTTDGSVLRASDTSRPPGHQSPPLRNPKICQVPSFPASGDRISSLRKKAKDAKQRVESTISHLSTNPRTPPSPEKLMQQSIVARSGKICEESGILMFKPTINVYGDTPGRGADGKERTHMNAGGHVQRTNSSYESNVNEYFQEADHFLERHQLRQPPRRWPKVAHTGSDDDDLKMELAQLAKSEKELRDELESVQRKSAERRWQAEYSKLSSSVNVRQTPDGRAVNVIDLSPFGDEAFPSRMDSQPSVEPESQDEVEIIFVEDSFLSTDSFSFGETKGTTFGASFSFTKRGHSDEESERIANCGSHASAELIGGKEDCGDVHRLGGPERDRKDVKNQVFRHPHQGRLAMARKRLFPSPDKLLAIDKDLPEERNQMLLSKSLSNGRPGQDNHHQKSGTQETPATKNCRRSPGKTEERTHDYFEQPRACCALPSACGMSWYQVEQVYRRQDSPTQNTTDSAAYRPSHARMHERNRIQRNQSKEEKKVVKGTLFQNTKGTPPGVATGRESKKNGLSSNQPKQPIEESTDALSGERTEIEVLFNESLSVSKDSSSGEATPWDSSSSSDHTWLHAYPPNLFADVRATTVPCPTSPIYARSSSRKTPKNVSSKREQPRLDHPPFLPELDGEVSFSDVSWTSRSGIHSEDREDSSHPSKLAEDSRQSPNEEEHSFMSSIANSILGCQPNGDTGHQELSQDSERADSITSRSCLQSVPSDVAEETLRELLARHKLRRKNCSVLNDDDGSQSLSRSSAVYLSRRDNDSKTIQESVQMDKTKNADISHDSVYSRLSLESVMTDEAEERLRDLQSLRKAPKRSNRNISARSSQSSESSSIVYSSTKEGSTTERTYISRRRPFLIPSPDNYETVQSTPMSGHNSSMSRTGKTLANRRSKMESPTYRRFLESRRSSRHRELSATQLSSKSAQQELLVPDVITKRAESLLAARARAAKRLESRSILVRRFEETGPSDFARMEAGPQPECRRVSRRVAIAKKRVDHEQPRREIATREELTGSPIKKRKKLGAGAVSKKRAGYQPSPYRRVSPTRMKKLTSSLPLAARARNLTCAVPGSLLWEAIAEESREKGRSDTE